MIKKKKQVGLGFKFAVFFLLLCFFIALVLAVTGEVPKIDMEILNGVKENRISEINDFFIFITSLASLEFILIVSAFILIILYILQRNLRALFLFLTVATGGAIYRIIKILIQRPRPELESALIPAGEFSFPSGHAAAATLFYGVMGIIFWKLLKKKWQKILMLFFLIMLIFLIGFSRIYLGVHWFTDVLGGWILGLLVIFSSVFIFKKISKKDF